MEESSQRFRYLICHVFGKQEELLRFYDFVSYCEQKPKEVRCYYEQYGCPTLRDVLIHLGMKKREAEKMQEEEYWVGGVYKISFSKKKDQLLLIIRTPGSRHERCSYNDVFNPCGFFDYIKQYFQLEFIFCYDHKRKDYYKKNQYERKRFHVITNDIHGVYYKTHRGKCKYELIAMKPTGEPLFDGFDAVNYFDTREELSDAMEKITGRKYITKGKFYYLLRALYKMMMEKEQCSFYVSYDPTYYYYFLCSNFKCPQYELSDRMNSFVYPSNLVIEIS